MIVSDLDSLRASSSIVFECVYGSTAFGLATPTSDIDIRGVFIAPFDDFLGFSVPDLIADERSNEVYWEIGRFFALCLKNNPTALETLGVDAEHIRVCTPLFQSVRPELFLSKLCAQSFVGYARTQMKKARGLNKKITSPVAVERKGILDFVYVVEGPSSIPVVKWLDEHGLRQEECGLTSISHVPGTFAVFAAPAPNYRGMLSGPDAEDLSVSSVPMGESPIAIVSFNRDAFRKHCTAFREYWDWVGSRNEERYQTNMTAGQDFDTKNMMHVFRLLMMAEDIATKGQLITRRPEREALLAIRRGERGFDDLMTEADTRIAALTELFERSTLPDEPNAAVIEELLIKIRRDAYAPVSDAAHTG